MEREKEWIFRGERIRWNWDNMEKRGRDTGYYVKNKEKEKERKKK